MLQFALQIPLSMIIFKVGVNRISGAHYFGNATSEAFLLSLMMVVAGFVLWLLYYAFIVGTLGIGALIAVPLRFLLSWLVPTLQLLLVARWYPKKLVFDTGRSVLKTGLVFFVMQIVTEFI